MPLNNFTRPDLPYIAAPLPNNNRFEIITRILRQPLKFDVIEAEINSLIDNMNKLDRDIQGLVAGIIPGSNNILNQYKIPTTDGLGNISWVNITDGNIDDGTISGLKLTDSSIISDKLANGIITPDKIPNMSIPYIKMNFADESIPYSKINFPDGSLEGDIIVDDSIPTGKLKASTVGTDELKDGSVTTEKIADGSVTLLKLAQEVLSLLPIGSIITFAGTTGISAAFIECDGQALNRVTYATLFANIGTTYGSGDGVTTFNVPDLRGRITVGISSTGSTNGLITGATAADIALGKTFGAETVTLDTTQIPSHNHDLTVTEASFSGGVGSTTWRVSAPSGSTTENTGGGLPHNNTQPSLFMRYYIRAL